MRQVNLKNYDLSFLWLDGHLEQRVFTKVWHHVIRNITTSLYDVVVQFRRQHL